LQDLGIGLEGGMLTLGGENILSSILGDSAIGSALDSITGGLGGALGGSLGIGGGNSYFGGKNVISTICTCSLGTDYIWVVTNPPQYMGSYLFSPLSSKIYEQYTFIGTFNALGSYSPGEGECLMYHGEECDDELSKITKGKINSKPGVGTAAGI
jgi:hypothetical protein